MLFAGLGDVVEQVSWVCAKRGGDPPEYADGWVAAAALDTPKVGQVYLRVEREVLLGEPPPDPEATHVRSYHLAPIHRWTWAAPLRQGLGTICPIDGHVRWRQGE